MKAALLPLALFVLLSALLTGGWVFVQEREAEVLRTRLDVTASQVAARVEDFLDRRLDALAELASRLAREGAPSEERHRRLASELLAAHPGFQALNWVDAEGTIRWVHPEEANRKARGFHLREHPTAGAAFLEAERGTAVAVTPPLELLQGGWGFAAYQRVADGAGTLGYLNGVFRVETVLAGSLPRPEDRELSYVLSSGERELGTWGPVVHPDPDVPAARAPVRAAGLDWVLAVVAPPQASPAAATGADDLLLLGGIALAAALAWMLHVARGRRVEAELAARRTRILIDNAPDAIVALDPRTGHFVDGNARALRLFEVTPEELRTLGPADLSPEIQPDGRASREVAAEYVRRATEGETPTFAWVHRSRSGREIPTEIQLVRLPGPDRDLVRGSVTDVTERRELEEKLRRAQVLEAMGRLAGGVAHDFNNLLTGILGASELLETRLGHDPEARELAREATAACQRAGELTRQLLAFSRHSVLKPELLDLGAMVRRLTTMLRRVVGERITIETDLAEDLGLVLADASQMELVLLNLILNARDAMPSGGRIAVRTRDVEGEVVLSVRDEGGGIRPQDLERIFQPYFTTKTPETGTGIGLATVEHAVEVAGGRVDVETALGRGSTFHVCLPRAEGAVPRERERPARELAPGEGVVLLVEDDAAVRGIASQALELAGYQVLAAASAEEALRIADEREGTIDLLITDVVLPRMSGPELVERIQTVRPGLATLLVSGYAAEEFDATRLSTGELEVLSKPFTPSSLTARVGAILGLRT